MTTPQSIYEFYVTDINGREHSLKEYKGNVLLFVNVASKCGLAKHSYSDMASILTSYHDRGLRILLFPCSQFLNQELDDLKSIEEFVKTYHDKFILMNSVNVRGSEAHPLFKFLSNSLPGTLTNSVKWNFTYFLVDRSGIPVKRYGPTTRIRADDPELLKCLGPTL